LPPFAAWTRAQTPSQSGEDRLVPPPDESAPLSSLISRPFPVPTSPEIVATSGVERQIGPAAPAPGTYGLPFGSNRQFVEATPVW
jgi:hypothetical protein